MKFEIEYKGHTMLLDDVKNENSGVLIATVVAEHGEESCAFIKVDKPRKLIVSGNYVLQECNAKIYDSIESYKDSCFGIFEL